MTMVLSESGFTRDSVGDVGTISATATSEDSYGADGLTPACVAALTMLRTFCQSRPLQSLLGSMRDLMNADPAGKMDFYGFAAGLRALNVDLSNDDYQRIFDMLDVEQCAAIDVAYFVNQMRSDEGESRFNRVGIGRQQLYSSNEAPHPSTVKLCELSGYARTNYKQPATTATTVRPDWPEFSPDVDTVANEAADLYRSTLRLRTMPPAR